MKIAAATLLALPLLAFAQDAEPKRSADEIAVERAMKDYVEGFYQAKPELIERGVSKDLKKMGYWRNDETGEYSDAMHMNFEQAVTLAKRWNADGQQGENLKYEVEVYEVADKTACGKLSAKWGIDYFQLAKEGEAWKIHHVMWQSHPPKAQ